MKKLTIKAIEESIELLNNSEPNKVILIGFSRGSIEKFDNAVREQCLYNSTGQKSTLSMWKSEFESQ